MKMPNQLNLKNKYWIYLSLLILLGSLFQGCRKQMYNQDLQDCDNIADYYEEGEHFIRRDLVTDDGVVDRKKLFAESKEKNSECFPTKTFGTLKK